MITTELGRVLNKILNPVGWWSIIIGAVALVLMMSIVVIDVISRSTLNIGVPGCIDLVGLLLIIVFFSGYAYAESHGEHIQVHAFVGKLPKTTQKVVVVNGYFLTIGITALLCWRFFWQMEFLREGHYVTGLLHIPLWPFVMLAGCFIGLFVLTLLSTFLKHVDELLLIKGVNGYLWLLPGIILASGLFVFSLWPSLAPFEISQGLWGGIIMLLLFVLIFLGIHIGAAMALMSLFGLSYLSGTVAGLTNLSMTAVYVAGTYTWSVVPLFMWMGLLVFRAGFARELYATAYKWIGHVPGGLASSTTVACAGLAAITGDTMTGVIAMGSISLPEMKAYGYDSKLATGCICTAATIGVLIPPSIAFIIYGMLTQVSIGKLFMAGIIPGILFTSLLIALITIRCFINPNLGPPGPRIPWKERLVSLKDIWAVVLLIVLVLGGLYAGLFTPTEAGAIGAGGALVIGLARRRLNFRDLTSSGIEAVRMTAVIMFIFVFANAFTGFLAITNLPYDLADWVAGLALSPYAVISLILIIYVALGCIMNSVPAIILTLPIFFPIAVASGFDPIWFGVLIVVMVEIGVVTPPIGMNVFAMSTIAKDVPMYTIFRGVLPFWVAFLVLVIILVLFPQISLFLPSLM